MLTWANFLRASLTVWSFLTSYVRTKVRPYIHGEGRLSPYSVQSFTCILFEGFLRQDTEVANVTVTLVFSPNKELTLCHVTLRVLLLLAHRTTVFGLFVLYFLEIIASFLQCGGDPLLLGLHIYTTCQDSNGRTGYDRPLCGYIP